MLWQFLCPLASKVKLALTISAQWSFQTSRVTETAVCFQTLSTTAEPLGFGK